LITTVFANWRVSLKTGGVGKDGGEKQRGGKFSTKKVVHFFRLSSLFFFSSFSRLFVARQRHPSKRTLSNHLKKENGLKKRRKKTAAFEKNGAVVFVVFDPFFLFFI
jgi:hypothetical protein